MRNKSLVIFNSNLSKRQYVLNEYDSQRILNMIRHYHELKSAAEISGIQYGRGSSNSGSNNGKDEIMCILADIDQGVTVLSSRQLQVVKLLSKGYLIKEIGEILDIKRVTVNFHIRQVGNQIANYLNEYKTEKGEKV